MSIIHVTQIANKLKELFDGKIDVTDIPATDREREVKFLSRAVAAYAVYSHTACTPEQAAMSIVDGGEDNGLDAIYYSEILKEFVLVQSKWIKSGSGEPESGEILKFCVGVESLINLEFEKFNSKVVSRQVEITNALAKFDTKYTLIVAYTGDKGLAEHGQRAIDSLLGKLNDAGEAGIEDLIKFKKFDQGRIYTSLSRGLLSDPLDIEIGLRQWGKYTEPFTAYYGFVSGEEISKLWEQYDRKLFHKNIRNVLGKTEVNDELQQTIQNSPDNFWYFNNGITIIADKIEKSMIGGTGNDLGAFRLQNASIVNGAQTISSIGASAVNFPEKVKKVFVSARFISLQDSAPGFGNEVTKSNNRQNRIENRDFVSQDPQQVRLKEELAHDSIIYNIVRTDQFVRSNTAFEVEEATVSLACASGNVALVVQAKREIGKFFENLDKGIYKQIFNQSTTGRYLLNCRALNKLIEELISGMILDLEKRAGREYGVLVHGNRMISSLVFDQIQVSKTDVMTFDYVQVAPFVVDAVRSLTEVTAINFADDYLATLFKNRSKCEALKQFIPK